VLKRVNLKKLKSFKNNTRSK